MSVPRASRPQVAGYGISPAPKGEGLLPWRWAVERLTRSHNYWLATVRPDGAPHLMPVWGIWQDDAFRFSTGAASRKARNLRVDPRCVVSTESADESVILEAVVETLAGEAAIQAFLAAYNAKYPGSLDASWGPFYLARPQVVFGFIEHDGQFSKTATRWRFEAEGGLAALPAGYAIRRAHPAEVALLPAIERAAALLFRDFGLAEIFSDVLTSEQDLEHARADGRLWVAAGPDRCPVGFAIASRVGGNAHLDELDVHPDHGRRGLGRALVDAVICWARKERLPALTLTTLRHVPWNAPFYERLGFHVLEEAAQGPILTEILREEVERGLPAENRVAMRLAL
jgi:GNAT superfamily N-acetyltransferase